MSNSGRVKVGIIGSQFEADIHAASIKMASEEVEVAAVASPTPGNAAALAKRYGIPRVFTDYREMLKERDIEMITIAAPNKLHAQMTADCAQAGKHVVCEKPLAMTIEECEQMIHVTRQAGVLLLYAEELFFTPKYLKAKEMADDGAFGKIHVVKQSEKHFGPHAEWFWDVDRCGGGALMDLGCHGIAFCYWFLGRPAIQSVYCQMGTYVHADKTRGDDEAYCILEFENKAMGIVENSWGRRGGMDDRIEVYGSDHQRLELSGFRGVVELWLPSGDDAFRALCAGPRGTPDNWGRWAGRHEDLVRCLRIRRGRTKNTNAFLRERPAETHRPLVSRPSVSAARQYANEGLNGTPTYHMVLAWRLEERVEAEALRERC